MTEIQIELLHRRLLKKMESRGLIRKDDKGIFFIWNITSSVIFSDEHLPGLTAEWMIYQLLAIFGQTALETLLEDKPDVNSTS